MDALDTIITNVIDKMYPVIFEIHFNSEEGLFKMSEGYSAYPEEDEVLIQDGLTYTVIGNEEVRLAKNYSKPCYYLIKL